MAKSLSPLRYPGGKSKIYDKVKLLIETNAMGNRTYVEPFAGGFGIGIALLCDNVVQTAVLNDFDVHIFHFWDSVLNKTEELLKKINDITITIEEREKQINIYKDNSADELSDGFATLFLNRVNYSGVIKGGPIGGLSQKGTFKIDCRFNKSEITKKIESVALLRNRIVITNCDASDLIINRQQRIVGNAFYNIDPPYVVKGNRLYTNFFDRDDHRSLERVISEHLNDTPWIVTYDDCELIREIYGQRIMREYQIQHNAGGTVKGKELIITNIPEQLFVW